MKKVGIVMGSDSDLPILRKTMDTLASLGIPYECHVYSAHRTPEEARTFALSARSNGFGVIIAAAGMAAHLAGAIAANTTLPVIGIPCKSTCLDGIIFVGLIVPWLAFHFLGEHPSNQAKKLLNNIKLPKSLAVSFLFLTFAQTFASCPTRLGF